MTQRTKQIIVAVIVIIVAFFGFKMFFAPDTTGDVALVTEQATTLNFAEGQIILSLLGKLNQVTLDRSVFSNKVFLSLINFEQPIEDQVVGRQNPFLPIGKDSPSSLLPLATTTRTR
jgi:aminopeptidase-like protein